MCFSVALGENVIEVDPGFIFGHGYSRQNSGKCLKNYGKFEIRELQAANNLPQSNHPPSPFHSTHLYGLQTQIEYRKTTYGC